MYGIGKLPNDVNYPKIQQKNIFYKKMYQSGIISTIYIISYLISGRFYFLI